MSKSNMKTYDCLVRLSGSLEQVVQKRGVTVPEIHILTKIHGENQVIDIEPSEMKTTMTEPELREMLKLRYDTARGLKVDVVFGGAFNAMPSSLGELGIKSDSPLMKRPSLKAPPKKVSAKKVKETKPSPIATSGVEVVDSLD